MTSISEAGDEPSRRVLLLEGRRLRVIRDFEEKFVFRFEFGPAILSQVREKLELLQSVPLFDISTDLAPHPGFYQLFLDDESVYVGRSTRPVGERLREHARKLRGRFAAERLHAKYVFVEDLSLVGLSETALIDYFHPLGLNMWGRMGFGSKAPGHNRGRQESEWQRTFPPDMQILVRAGKPHARTLRKLILQVNRTAPITLSVPRRLVARFDRDHAEPFVELEAERPFVEWASRIERRLEDGWRLSREAMGWYFER